MKKRKTVAFLLGGFGLLAGLCFMLCGLPESTGLTPAIGDSTRRDIDLPVGEELPGAARLRSASANMPFTYRGAIFGTLPSLPNSKMATAGIAVDLDSRQVIWAKNPRKAVPIASMTKMMTALLAFEAVAMRKDISMKSIVPVSKSAMKIGGSQVYLDVRESFPLGDLLKTVMIVSANDSAQLVAEFIGNGDVGAFIRQMNRRAEELHLAGARFYNPHGLPGASAAEDNVCSCEGLVLLGEQLLSYTKAVSWASTWLDWFRENSNKPFQLRNHNRLVKDCPGVNGMKTGYIRRSGYCVTITCERDGRRFAVAVTGFPSWRKRDRFVRKLLDWAYRQPIAVPSMARQRDIDLPVGAELTYALMWKGVHAGDIVLRVGEKVRLRNRLAYPVTMRCQSGAVLSAIYAIQDEIKTWIDAERGVSVRFARKVREGTWDVYRADEQVDFDYEAGKVIWTSVDYEDGKPQGEDRRERPLDGPVQDPLSVLYSLRAHPLKEGMERDVRIASRKDTGEATLQAGEAEPVAIPGLGTFEAYRLTFSSPDTDKTNQKVELFLKEGDLRVLVDRKTNVPLKLELTGVPIIGEIQAVLRGARNSSLRTITSGKTK